MLLLGRPDWYGQAMSSFKLDHVAVAVRDFKDAIDGFENKLGVKCDGTEVVPTEKVEVAFFDLGGPRLELVCPIEEDAPMQRSLDKRGEGLHHIALEVDDLEAAIKLAKAAGLRMINEEPQPASGGMRLAFIHPKSLNGVMVELVEKPEGYQGH